MVTKFQMTHSEFSQLSHSLRALPVIKIQAVAGVELATGRGGIWHSDTSQSFQIVPLN